MISWEGAKENRHPIESFLTSLCHFLILANIFFSSTFVHTNLHSTYTTYFQHYPEHRSLPNPVLVPILGPSYTFFSRLRVLFIHIQLTYPGIIQNCDSLRPHLHSHLPILVISIVYTYSKFDTRLVRVALEQNTYLFSCALVCVIVSSDPFLDSRDTDLLYSGHVAIDKISLGLLP